MKYSSAKVILLFCAILIGGCVLKKNESTSIQYSTKKYERKISDSDSGFAKVSFEFPEITKTNDAIVKDSIEAYILNTFLDCYYNNKKAKSLEELKDSIFLNYKNLRKSFPESPNSWEVEGICSVIYDDNSFVSLNTKVYSFLGGAHPNEVVKYVSFDSRNGKQIKLIEVINNKTALTDIAEKIFRNLKSLKPDEDLQTAGFWFTDNKFALNKNFAVSNEGLIFYYNPYEIAPYVLGSTELLIPFDKIRELIKKDGLLAGMMKANAKQ